MRTIGLSDRVKESVRRHKPALGAAGAAGQKTGRESLIDRAAVERHEAARLAVRAAGYGAGGVGLRNDPRRKSGHRIVERDQPAEEAIGAAADRAGREALADGSDVDPTSPPARCRRRR